MDCDVLVVGLGPAGCGAAQAAAAAGAKVLAIDRKKEIGVPVQCGEVIGKGLLRSSGLKLPRQAICSHQDHTRFVIDRSISIRNYAEQWASVSVERKILDKLLAARAATEGASVQADTTLIDLDINGDIVESATLRMRGRDVTVHPKTLIAADGVHSTVAKMTGVCWSSPDMVAHGGEFEMISKRPLPRCMQIFIEEEVGLGYGWIIPKGRKRANVGLAEVGDRGRIRDRVEKWVEDNPIVSHYFDTDCIIEVKSGDAPVPGFQGGPVRGNVLYTGDAAGQTLAFVGEGIVPAYLCGLVAGECAARSPEMYDSVLRERMGDEMDYASDLKDVILSVWQDESLNLHQRFLVAGMVMSESISPESLEKLIDGEMPSFQELKRMAGSSNPHVRMSKMIGRRRYKG